MDRRGFLRIAAVLGASTLPQFRIIPEGESVTSNEALIGYVRELKHYDLLNDSSVLRYDIMTSAVQLGIDISLSRDEADCIDSARSTALDALRNEMISLGLDINSLIPLDQNGEFSSPLSLHV